MLAHHNSVRKMWEWDIDMLGKVAPKGVGNFQMSVRHGNYDSLDSRHQTKMNVSSFVDMVSVCLSAFTPFRICFLITR